MWAREGPNSSKTQDYGFINGSQKGRATLIKLGPKGGQQNRTELKMQQAEPTPRVQAQV